MYLSGIADEAGKPIERQIEAIQTLGWKHIELRAVQVNDHSPAVVHDLPDKDFDILARELEEADLQVSCFGSAIGNWQKSVQEPFDSSIEEARRCIPRMKRLNCKYVRVMSMRLEVDEQGRPLPPEEQHAEERFARMREMQQLFSDEGLQPVHENCMNYGGMGYTYTLQLLEQVPGLQLLFDTGNPGFSLDFTKPEPRPRQSAWEFYSQIKEHIAYVHIKDCVWSERDHRETYTFPGEGVNEVPRIVDDLARTGYRGYVSIEPHMAAVLHRENETSDERSAFDTFVEYGRRMQAIRDHAMHLS